MAEIAHGKLVEEVCRELLGNGETTDCARIDRILEVALKKIREYEGHGSRDGPEGPGGGGGGRSGNRRLVRV